MTDQYDIIIVGAGMVGASMACALNNSEYKIAAIEAFEFNADNQPSFDERTVALTYSSKQIFNALGSWQAISSEAYPIHDIEVTNQNSFGFTTLGSRDIGTEALGYVVPTRTIGGVLHQQIQKQSNLDIYCPASVELIQTHEHKASIKIKQDEKITELSAKLIIMADGGRGGLHEQLGIKSDSKSYPQSALVGIVGTNQRHHGKAYEHFTQHGPLALLPLRDKDYALVWTLEKNQAQSLIDNSESDFLAQLQSAFGKRAGLFNSIGQRNIYPLSHSIINTPVSQRVVVIGNAAHTVHPVAGQGFNLGLRDVGFLHDVLTAKGTSDVGDSELLKHYAQLRQSETRRVSLFTDGLIKTFTSNLLPIAATRNIGLSIINLMPGAKRSLLKRTMGLHGRQSELMMSGK